MLYRNVGGIKELDYVEEEVIIIRTAQQADKEALLEIYKAALSAQTSIDDDYCDRLLQAGGLVVAEADGCVVGFGGIDTAAVEQLKWLYLSPEHQRAGIGSKILLRLEEIAWKANLRFVRLHSAPGALEFYRRHGYSLVPSKDAIGHDHDGVEMIKVRPSNV
jgi:GNAT superfamily N-acetyltransferase